MPATCCVLGCSSRWKKNTTVRFFRFPLDPGIRAQWEAAVGRPAWKATDSTRICSMHFVTGEPQFDQVHPDYVPSVHLKSCQNEVKTSQQRVKRYERAVKRQHAARQLEEAAAVADNIEPNQPEEEACQKKMKHMEQENEELKMRVQQLTAENEQLREEVQVMSVKTTMNADLLNGDDNLTRFYTGLTTFFLFTTLFKYLSQGLRKPIKLRLIDEYLLVLMKIRLNLRNEDLAFRFGITNSTVSRVFHKWISLMYIKLKDLIRWPDKETVKITLPNAFKKHYSNVRCIIDCTEIFIQRPTFLKARAQTYSNYKKHNTVKFLIGITPNGVICYLSKCWGGRVSDKELTRESGFLDKLEYGDRILADRGFLIEEELAIRGVSMSIPAFTKGHTQLPQSDVESTRQIANVRIHVERVIGLLKNRFSILQSQVPITLVKRPSDKDVATIDKLVTICAALTNMGEPIV